MRSESESKIEYNLAGDWNSSWANDWVIFAARISKLAFWSVLWPYKLPHSVKSFPYIDTHANDWFVGS